MWIQMQTSPNHTLQQAPGTSLEKGSILMLLHKIRVIVQRILKLRWQAWKHAYCSFTRLSRSAFAAVKLPDVDDEWSKGWATLPLDLNHWNRSNSQARKVECQPHTEKEKADPPPEASRLAFRSSSKASCIRFADQPHPSSERNPSK